MRQVLAEQCTARRVSRTQRTRMSLIPSVGSWLQPTFRVVETPEPVMSAIWPIDGRWPAPGDSWRQFGKRFAKRREEQRKHDKLVAIGDDSVCWSTDRHWPEPDMKWTRLAQRCVRVKPQTRVHLLPSVASWLLPLSTAYVHAMVELEADVTRHPDEHLVCWPTHGRWPAPCDTWTKFSQRFARLRASQRKYDLAAKSGAEFVSWPVDGRWPAPSEAWMRFTTRFAKRRTSQVARVEVTSFHMMPSVCSWMSPLPRQVTNFESTAEHCVVIANCCSFDGASDGSVLWPCDGRWPVPSESWTRFSNRFAKQRAKESARGRKPVSHDSPVLMKPSVGTWCCTVLRPTCAVVVPATTCHLGKETSKKTATEHPSLLTKLAVEPSAKKEGSRQGHYFVVLHLRPDRSVGHKPIANNQ